MPRIRTIKPEMFQDEKLAPLGVVHRFVFLGLIAMADDAGRLLDNVKVIDAFVFPESDDSSRESLEVLTGLGVIARGVTESGQRVVQISKWSAHQKIDKPNFSAALPAISGLSPTDRRAVAESSANRRRGFPPMDEAVAGTIADASAPHICTYDLRPTTDVGGASPPPTVPSAAPRPVIGGEGVGRLLAMMSPERGQAMAARFDGWLEGMGLGPGLRATVADIELACQDLLDTAPASPPSPSAVRGFVEKCIRRRLADIATAATPGDAGGAAGLSASVARSGQRLWETVTAAIRNRPWRMIDRTAFTDGEWRVIGQVGGLGAIAEMSPSDMPHVQRRFVAAYAAVRSAAPLEPREPSEPLAKVSA